VSQAQPPQTSIQRQAAELAYHVCTTTSLVCLVAELEYIYIYKVSEQICKGARATAR